MRVRVKLFASFREIAGRREIPWTAAEGATVADLLAALLERYPALRGHWETMLLAVNHEFAEPSAVLREGDEVAIMPPVSGGLL